MRSNLDDATRQRILADIGIDVWRLRTGKSAGSEGSASGSGPSTARPGDRANLALAEAGRGSPGMDSRSGPAAAAAVTPGSQESRSGGRSNREGSRSEDRSYTVESRSGDRSGPGAASMAGSVEPFAVRSLAADGVILLLEREPIARERLLVRDLFAAATGRWDCEPVLRRFDWPPAVALPGADDPGAADRALRAFVAGELADHGCTLLLLAGPLAGRLGELRRGGERLIIPDLAVLGRDPAEKRRLWAAIRQYRHSAADNPVPVKGRGGEGRGGEGRGGGGDDRGGAEVPPEGALPEGERS